MAEILSAQQVLLYPRGSKLRFQPHGPGASGREKFCPRRTYGHFVLFATSTLTEKITKLRLFLLQLRAICTRHLRRSSTRTVCVSPTDMRPSLRCLCTWVFITQEHTKRVLVQRFSFRNGDSEGTRTPDLQRDRLAFYATELRSHI